MSLPSERGGFRSVLRLTRGDWNLAGMEPPQKVAPLKARLVTYNRRKLDNNADNIYNAENMRKSDYLGEFEHVVLLTLFRLGDGAYGAMIRAEIQRLTARDSTIGAVHATLERLERKGFVSSWTGEPTSERGGKAKRHFRIEAAGSAALKKARATQERLHAGLSLGVR